LSSVCDEPLATRRGLGTGLSLLADAASAGSLGVSFGVLDAGGGGTTGLEPDTGGGGFVGRVVEPVTVAVAVAVVVGGGGLVGLARDVVDAVADDGAETDAGDVVAEMTTARASKFTPLPL
jgi:hypothetical protein